MLLDSDKGIHIRYGFIPTNLQQYIHTHTHQMNQNGNTALTTTTTTVLWPFVRDYPGEPVPEETFTYPPS